MQKVIEIKFMFYKVYKVHKKLTRITKVRVKGDSTNDVAMALIGHDLAIDK